jgi:predicted phosphodiesterase
MRLLLVADLHYSLPQFDWVLDIASDFDVVVLAGDHLDLASLVDGRAQNRGEIFRPLAREDKARDARQSRSRQRNGR